MGVFEAIPFETWYCGKGALKKDAPNTDTTEKDTLKWIMLEGNIMGVKVKEKNKKN